MMTRTDDLALFHRSNYQCLDRMLWHEGYTSDSSRQDAIQDFYVQVLTDPEILPRALSTNYDSYLMRICNNCAIHNWRVEHPKLYKQRHALMHYDELDEDNTLDLHIDYHDRYNNVDQWAELDAQFARKEFLDFCNKREAAMTKGREASSKNSIEKILETITDGVEGATHDNGYRRFQRFKNAYVKWLQKPQ